MKLCVIFKYTWTERWFIFNVSVNTCICTKPHKISLTNTKCKYIVQKDTAPPLHFKQGRSLYLNMSHPVSWLKTFRLKELFLSTTRRQAAEVGNLQICSEGLSIHEFFWGKCSHKLIFLSHSIRKSSLQSGNGSFRSLL